jgi:hypothetical protein
VGRESRGYAPGRPTLAESTLNIVDGSTELLGPLMYGGHVVMATARVARSLQLRIPARAMHGVGPTRQGRGRVRSIFGS